MMGNLALSSIIEYIGLNLGDKSNVLLFYNYIKGFVK